MRVRVKRIDKSLPLPHYETKGAVGFDLLAREKMTIKSEEIALIPSNLIIEVPKGYALIIASRSSTPKRHGLTKPHGIGIIDQDYCGEKDEVKIQVFNFTKKSVTIPRGTRLAQGLFIRIDRAELKEVKEMRKKSRGGFGSTGQKIRRK